MEASIEESGEHFDDFLPADGQEQQSSEISKILQKELTETEEFKEEFDDVLAMSDDPKAALTEQAVTAAMTAAKILVRKLCFFVLVVVIVISPSLFSAAFDIRVISDTLDFFFIMISPSDDLLVWVVNIFFMMNLLSVSVLFLLFLVYLTDVDSLFTDTRDFKKFFRKN